MADDQYRAYTVAELMQVLKGFPKEAVILIEGDLETSDEIGTFTVFDPDDHTLTEARKMQLLPFKGYSKVLVINVGLDDWSDGISSTH